MLPRPSPEMECGKRHGCGVSVECSKAAAHRAPQAFRLLSGDDLISVVPNHDVVVRSKRIVVFGREWLVVSFNQTLIRRFQVSSASRTLSASVRSRLLDREREQVQGIVSVRDTDGCKDILRSLYAIFRF